MRRDQLNRRIQQTSLAAKAERPPGPQIIQQGKAVRHSAGGVIRKAYAKAAAGSGNTIVCYLDTDATGEEITVNCEIVGGSNLNAALPRLEDGTLLAVWDDAGTWRNAGNPFQASGDC